MPKKCIKFIPEYLIPSLDSKRFGERLKWIDKSAKMFEIDWSHKAGPHWSEQEAQVFVVSVYYFKLIYKISSHYITDLYSINLAH